jgi:tetratricopeptide (TPR) repeat protein
MTTPSIDHRQVAVDLFNHVWTLIETPDRTTAQDDEMLHAAHASRYHWGLVGKPVNLARGEWQCSRVYAMLGRGEPAIHHGRRCLEICQAEDLGDFDLAFAYEALARAHALAGDSEAAAKYLTQAVQAGTNIADQEDRTHFEGELASITSVVPR